MPEKIRKFQLNIKLNKIKIKNLHQNIKKKNKKIFTFASHSIPITTISSNMTTVRQPIILVSCIAPSMIVIPKEFHNKLRSDSQNPTTYMATATALARENMSPILPPNSGPSERFLNTYGLTLI